MNLISCSTTDITDIVKYNEYYFLHTSFSHIDATYPLFNKQGITGKTLNLRCMLHSYTITLNVNINYWHFNM